MFHGWCHFLEFSVRPGQRHWDVCITALLTVKTSEQVRCGGPSGRASLRRGSLELKISLGSSARPKLRHQKSSKQQQQQTPNYKQCRQQQQTHSIQWNNKWPSLQRVIWSYIYWSVNILITQGWKVVRVVVHLSLIHKLCFCVYKHVCNNSRIFKEHKLKGQQ